jgi:sugar phosphate permease
MWAPGLIGVAVGLLVLAAVRDKPTDLGYPPTDPAAQAALAAKQQQQKAQEGKDTTTAAAKPAASAGGGMMAALRSVMAQPAVWALAFTYFFIYVVRQVGGLGLAPASLTN